MGGRCREGGGLGLGWGYLVPAVAHGVLLLVLALHVRGRRREGGKREEKKRKEKKRKKEKIWKFFQT
jgi:hypothetical protein